MNGMKNVTFTGVEHCGKFEYNSSVHYRHVNPIRNSVIELITREAKAIGEKDVFVFIEEGDPSIKQHFNIYKANGAEGKLLNGITKNIKMTEALKPKEMKDFRDPMAQVLHHLSTSLENAKETLIKSVKTIK